MALKIEDVTITWLGHSGVQIEGSQRVYIDPYQIHSKDKEAADILLITHSHYDHLSVPDIEQLISEKTIICCPQDCQSKLTKFKVKQIHVLAPGEEITVEDVTIKAVAAYNEKKQFHPKENHWLGYLVTINGIRIYHTGDSDHTKAIGEVKCDVALLPVSGTYVMTPAEAAAAANKIKPEVAIPIHWGDFIGTREDAETFKKLTHCKTIILEKE